jgi:hypothetical protein
MCKIKLQNLILYCILFAACNICRGALITVESYTDSNGFYRCTAKKGDEPFLLGGGTNLCFQVQSFNVVSINDPPGWQSTEGASGIISWNFTNENVITIDAPIQFSFQSHNTDFVYYTEYPLGIIFGDIYNTNGTLYSPNSGPEANNFFTSVNIAGYEQFGYVGPVIPEPMLFWIFLLLVLKIKVWKNCFSRFVLI